jgi:hypothetical protein
MWDVFAEDKRRREDPDEGRGAQRSDTEGEASDAERQQPEAKRARTESPDAEFVDFRTKFLDFALFHRAFTGASRDERETWKTAVPDEKEAKALAVKFDASLDFARKWQFFKDFTSANIQRLAVPMFRKSMISFFKKAANVGEVSLPGTGGLDKMSYDDYKAWLAFNQPVTDRAHWEDMVDTSLKDEIAAAARDTNTDESVAKKAAFRFFSLGELKETVARFPASRNFLIEFLKSAKMAKILDSDLYIEYLKLSNPKAPIAKKIGKEDPSFQAINMTSASVDTKKKILAHFKTYNNLDTAIALFGVPRNDGNTAWDAAQYVKWLAKQGKPTAGLMPAGPDPATVNSITEKRYDAMTRKGSLSKVMQKYSLEDFKNYYSTAAAMLPEHPQLTPVYVNKALIHYAYFENVDRTEFHFPGFRELKDVAEEGEFHFPGFRELKDVAEEGDVVPESAAGDDGKKEADTSDPDEYDSGRQTDSEEDDATNSILTGPPPMVFKDDKEKKRVKEARRRPAREKDKSPSEYQTELFRNAGGSAKKMAQMKLDFSEILSDAGYLAALRDASTYGMQRPQNLQKARMLAASRPKDDFQFVQALQFFGGQADRSGATEFTKDTKLEELLTLLRAKNNGVGAAKLDAVATAERKYIMLGGGQTWAAGTNIPKAQDALKALLYYAARRPDVSAREAVIFFGGAPEGKFKGQKFDQRLFAELDKVQTDDEEEYDSLDDESYFNAANKGDLSGERNFARRNRAQGIVVDDDEQAVLDLDRRAEIEGQSDDEDFAASSSSEEGDSDDDDDDDEDDDADDADDAEGQESEDEDEDDVGGSGSRENGKKQLLKSVERLLDQYETSIAAYDDYDDLFDQVRTMAAELDSDYWTDAKIVKLVDDRITDLFADEEETEGAGDYWTDAKIVKLVDDRITDLFADEEETEGAGDDGDGGESSSTDDSLDPESEYAGEGTSLNKTRELFPQAYAAVVDFIDQECKRFFVTLDRFDDENKQASNDDRDDFIAKLVDEIAQKTIAEFQLLVVYDFNTVEQCSIKKREGESQKPEAKDGDQEDDLESDDDEEEEEEEEDAEERGEKKDVQEEDIGYKGTLCGDNLDQVRDLVLYRLDAAFVIDVIDTKLGAVKAEADIDRDAFFAEILAACLAENISDEEFLNKKLRNLIEERISRKFGRGEEEEEDVLSPAGDDRDPENAQGDAEITAALILARGDLEEAFALLNIQ